MFGFFAALAEFEHELIVERTKAGLASARARGRNGGRRFKMTASKLRLAQAAMGRPRRMSRSFAKSSASLGRRYIGTSTRKAGCGLMGSRCSASTRGKRPQLRRTPDMRRKRPSGETLVLLRRRLEELPPRSEARLHLIEDCAHLHGVSTDTIYRALRDQFRPRSLHRRDQGKPRKVERDDMERYCEIIAALKVRTSNNKGRHLSTNRALEILVDYGVETRKDWSGPGEHADEDHRQSVSPGLGI